METGFRKFTAAIDQGTTSTRFFIFDERGEPVAKHQEEFDQIYPHAGWVEHDPSVLIKSVENCIEVATCKFVASGYNTQDICALGITNQRETSLVWDIRSGEVLYNAVVWADSRTTHIVRQLKLEGAANRILLKTGLPLSTYPSAVKVKWILEHSKAARDVYEAGYLAFGTVDTWLLYNLAEGYSGERLHVTDVTNASRTLFFDINTLQYDPFLTEFFGLEKLLLPKVASSSNSRAYGVLSKGPLKGLRITGCLGDQSAALVGQKAFEQGMAKNTYGTGCFMLYNTGNQPVVSRNGLLTTIAFQFENRPPVYALEGSIAVAGSAVKFLRDNLGIIREANEIGELAMSVQDSGGVVFVTAFAGLFAPYWVDDAQGTIFGITNYTKKEHICRATIEATCFQTKAIMDAMEKGCGITIKNLAVDGGMSNSDECMQLQADIIGIDVDRPAMRETTALGAAIAAGFGVELWLSFDDLRGINSRNHRKFGAQTTPTQRTRRFRQWERAVAMSKGWLTSEDIDKEYDD
ncbi:Glycerol kinase [Orbilia oligospora]|uniref:glycerol kinase n=1 Tax=Orbilia oligospora TaxID=2813651 RepID=A0A7C8UC35_ORBOL|nr:Glycerol kinase [Orbilia oligospora]